MSLKNYRLFNVKRIVALMLVIVFSFQSMVINTYAAVPISNGKGAILLNDDLDNIVYLYESDGETYKAVESISDDFSQVSTKIYKEVNGECLVYNKNTQNCRGDSPKLQREIPQ